MPVTAVTLVVDLTDSIVAFHRQLPGPDAFLLLVEPGAKMGEPATHPGQPLVRHTPGLGRFQTVSTGDPFGEQSHWHGLTQGSQVHGIGVVADKSLYGSSGLAVLTLADLDLVFLGVTVQDDGGSTY